MSSQTLQTSPGLSLVMPCYNEEAIVAQTIRRTLSAFDESGHRVEIVAVDNGSRDRTRAVIADACERDSRVKLVSVAVNEGYGQGILSGLPHCAEDWIGMIPADSQVDAADTVRLFEEALACEEPVLAKARRRFRMDGVARKIVSITYNALFRLLWPRVASLDVNGLPKIFPRNVARQLDLTSKDWFLDPEIMIKTHYLGVRCIEYNVFARMRSRGLSHVNASTVGNFFVGLMRYRFSSALSAWRRARLAADVPTASHSGGLR